MYACDFKSTLQSRPGCLQVYCEGTQNLLWGKIIFTVNLSEKGHKVDITDEIVYIFANSLFIYLFLF